MARESWIMNHESPWSWIMNHESWTSTCTWPVNHESWSNTCTWPVNHESWYICLTILYLLTYLWESGTGIYALLYYTYLLTYGNREICCAHKPVAQACRSVGNKNYDTWCMSSSKNPFRAAWVSAMLSASLKSFRLRGTPSSTSDGALLSLVLMTRRAYFRYSS